MCVVKWNSEICLWDVGVADCGALWVSASYEDEPEIIDIYLHFPMVIKVVDAVYVFLLCIA